MFLTVYFLFNFFALSNFSMYFIYKVFLWTMFSRYVIDFVLFFFLISLKTAIPAMYAPDGCVVTDGLLNIHFVRICAFQRIQAKEWKVFLLENISVFLLYLYTFSFYEFSRILTKFKELSS